MVPGRHPVKTGAKGSHKASRKASRKVSRKAKPWNLQHLPLRKVKGFPRPKTLLWQPWRPPLKAPLQDALCGGAGWLAVTRVSLLSGEGGEARLYQIAVRKSSAASQRDTKN